jgi:hypothetical protein
LEPGDIPNIGRPAMNRGKAIQPFGSGTVAQKSVNLLALGKQPPRDMRPDESPSTGDEDAPHDQRRLSERRGASKDDCCIAQDKERSVRRG